MNNIFEQLKIALGLSHPKLLDPVPKMPNLNPVDQSHTVYDNSQIQPQYQPSVQGAATTNIDEYLRSKMPAGQQGMSLADYYPAYPFLSTASAQTEKQFNRPGWRDYTLARAFNESTLGRGKTLLNNLFGMKPGADSGFTGYPSQEQAYQRFIDHSSGKAGYMMPILNGSGPITQEDVIKVNGGYNPENAYLNEILKFFPKAKGG